ncbi:MAG: aminopeptidase N [Planctomycetota bacterium]
MSDETPQPVYRKDYEEPACWIDSIDLCFDLGEHATEVRSRMHLRRNGEKPELVLDGRDLELLELRLDGKELGPDAYRLDESSLTLLSVPEEFELETRVSIKPHLNTALTGLYKSSGNFCTQCEAEGFRRITFFLDRPDVMARYTTTIVADRERYPVLLSNGNRTETEELGDGRHRVKWVDPFPKPSYLFALVAGNLRSLDGEFVTRSGRRVQLEIWVEPRNLDKCEHALRSLQKAMKWDEEAFGREYDLDNYMVVAVSDFNMGAMENKGLNIFNSKYVLARPETATDTDFENIEGVIGHEYFHNWTGNRVTCRDWFQLTLKEGLTVFRDQQFTGDMTSKPVKRIKDVKTLRLAQFPEDAGPMSHPVRPESYIEMNNFYTSTVYNKGAEVIRMYHTLLGKEGFRKGMDLYFERHDGQAVTCDDFRAAMADANGVDLGQFERWYSQAGTPLVEASGKYDDRARSYELMLRQSLPRQDGQEEPMPLHVPVAVGLLGPDGSDMPLALEGDDAPPACTRILELREKEQSFTFTGIDAPPTPSLLRDYSAPVRVRMEHSRSELAFLMAHDSDAFNRWDAGQELALDLLLSLASDAAEGRPLVLDPGFVDAFAKVIADPTLDGSLKALALTLPFERIIGQQMAVIDPDAVHRARQFAIEKIASSLDTELLSVYETAKPSAPYSPDRESIDRRRLCRLALTYLAELPDTKDLAIRQFETSDNMTDSYGALLILCDIEDACRDEALAAFYERWKGDPLVVDKWFAAQAVSTLPGTFDRVAELAAHPDFSLTNPNRVHSLVTAFAMNNQVRFHGTDGRAYAFVADKVLELDGINPQVASRLASSFNQWRRFDTSRQGLIKAQLERIAGNPQLSKDVYEIVSRALEAPVHCL